MSPELFRGVKYSTKSDMWALGCVVYEMMALHVPFGANNISELASKVLKTEPPPLPEKFSSTLCAVRRRCARVLKRRSVGLCM